MSDSEYFRITGAIAIICMVGISTIAALIGAWIGHIKRQKTWAEKVLK